MSQIRAPLVETLLTQALCERFSDRDDLTECWKWPVSERVIWSRSLRFDG